MIRYGADLMVTSVPCKLPKYGCNAQCKNQCSPLNVAFHVLLEPPNQHLYDQLHVLTNAFRTTWKLSNLIQLYT